jgi:hypothetical protein
VQSREDVFYPRRYEVFTRAIEILTEAGKSDPRLELALSSTIKSMANVQKNALGMVKGLARNAVRERKLREEAEFASWVEADPAEGRSTATSSRKFSNSNPRSARPTTRTSFSGRSSGARAPSRS